MYGWFEPGGGVNKYFLSTQMIDVLLRSSSTNNNIVIGNGSNPSATAAIYVQQNNVGIRRLPDPSYSLDTMGVARADTWVTQGWFASASNTGFASSNVLSTADGLSRTRVVVAESVLNYKCVLSNVTVSSIHYNNDNSYDMALALSHSSLLENITPDVILSVNDVLYKVIRLDAFNTFTIAPFFNDAPSTLLPFQNGDVIPTLNVLQNYQRDPFSSSTLISWFTITSLAITSSYQIAVGAQFLSPSDAANVFAGQYYSLSDEDAINNIVCLQSVVWITPLVAMLYLSTTDKTSFPIYTLSGGVGSNIALILLDVILPSMVEDTNVSIGTYVSPNNSFQNVLITGSKLDTFAYSQENATNTVNSIKVNGVTSYDITNVFVNADNQVLATLGQATQYKFATKGNITYTLNGLPFRLNAPPTLVAAGVYRYFVTDQSQGGKTLQKMIDQGYVGQHVMFACRDIVTRIQDIVAVGQQGPYLDLCVNIAYVPTVLLVPFKATILTSLGKDRCYVNNSLSIGTRVTTETLTVNGNASITNGLYLRDETSSVPFSLINYVNDQLYLGSGIVVTPSNIVLQNNAIVKGNLVVENVLSYSDQRLKKEIEPADTSHDLELIRSLDLKKFRMMTDPANTLKKRGLIAQDVEKIMPELVHYSSLTPLSDIGETAQVSAGRTLGIRGYGHLASGTCLSIRFDGGQDKVVTVVSANDDEIAIEEKELLRVGGSVYIVGTHDRLRLINQEQLMMTMLGALQAVIARI